MLAWREQSTHPYWMYILYITKPDDETHFEPMNTKNTHTNTTKHTQMHSTRNGRINCMLICMNAPHHAIMMACQTDADHVAWRSHIKNEPQHASYATKVTTSYAWFPKFNLNQFAGPDVGVDDGYWSMQTDSYRCARCVISFMREGCICSMHSNTLAHEHNQPRVNLSTANAHISHKRFALFAAARTGIASRIVNRFTNSSGGCWTWYRVPAAVWVRVMLEAE